MMKRLGMIKGAAEPQSNVIVIKEPLHNIRGVADCSGMIHMVKKPGSAIRKGEVLVRILNYFGDEVGRYLASDDGYLVTYPI